MTPTRYKAERKAMLERLSALRAELRAIRTLRASEKFLDREDAEGRLFWAWHEHNQIRAILRRLRAETVVAYSHLSPSAAAREQTRRVKG